jgi:choline dehydrogenase
MNSPHAWYGTLGATPVNRRNELRQGTLVTYVRRARGRPNFEVRGGALVDRVLLAGDRATGVRYVGADGRPHDVEADAVVLAGGVYGTPAILLRSGIGPPAHLGSLGIGVVQDLPVGERLLDHGLCYWHVEAPELAAMHGPSTGMFVRGHENDWFAVATVVDEETALCGLAFVSCGDNEAGPLRLSSTRPDAPPSITHRYDIGPFRECGALVERVLELAPFQGARNLDAGRSVEDVFRERVNTCYHPCGTCAIGRVVGPDLRVLGFENLLVADASVFPHETSNNTNETCYAIGEIAARLLGAPEPVGR